MALFFGGREIIPQLSSASMKSANIPLYFLAILSPVLQMFLQIYKRYKFRDQIKYEQQLQQTVMTGRPPQSRNLTARGIQLNSDIPLVPVKQSFFKKCLQNDLADCRGLISGVRNVYGTLIIFFGFLAYFVVFCFHFCLGEDNQDKDNTAEMGQHSLLGNIIMIAILSLFTILTPFIKNPKLRFGILVTNNNYTIFLLIGNSQQEKYLLYVIYWFF